MQELELLDEDSNIFKLIGPVLIKQDPLEATTNVKKRLEFIKGESDRLDAQCKRLEDKQHKRQSAVRSLAQHQYSDCQDFEICPSVESCVQFMDRTPMWLQLLYQKLTKYLELRPFVCRCGSWSRRSNRLCNQHQKLKACRHASFVKAEQENNRCQLALCAGNMTSMTFCGVMSNSAHLKWNGYCLCEPNKTSLNKGLTAKQQKLT